VTRYDRPLLSLVVPTRNECDNVDRLLARTELALHDVPWGWELLLVDDSDDDTPQRAEAAAGRGHPVRVLHRPLGERRGGLSGAVLAGSREPSSERRVHLAVYAARPDARALVHTHSEHATAWSHGGEPLGEVLTAGHAPSGSDEIAAAAVEALGNREAVLLGRHGVLALGASPAAALEVAAAVEERARAARRLSD